MKRRTAPEGRSTQRPRSVPGKADIVARLIWVAEALEAGDIGAAQAVLLDLLDELRPSDQRPRCPECGLRMWPGELPKHVSVVHLVDPYGVAA